MMLYISGIENSIKISRGITTTFEIHNNILFERICRSLMLFDDKNTVEPYTLCRDDGSIVSPTQSILVIPSPLSLPWNDKLLSGALYKRMVSLMMEHDDVVGTLDEYARLLSSHLSALALELDSEYCFTNEWDAQRYMKAFGFSVEHSNEDATFDKCIKFLSLAHDVSFNKILVFIGLKSFLGDTERNQLLNHVFLMNLQVLLIENMIDNYTRTHERKYVVDQHFLESCDRN